MAPIRRYLRISQHSVLECRIYLDNPSLAQSWLLNPRDPVLPRVIESIRPLVVPKLREERERDRGKKKSSKKRSIKDVVVQNDFEVSIFLTETSTRHSLLTRHKLFREKAPRPIQSNSTRLISETERVPVEIEDDGGSGGGDDGDAAVSVLREHDSDDEDVRLADIPVAEPCARPKRRRNTADEAANQGDDAASAVQIDSDGDEPAPKRTRGAAGTGVDEQDDDDDKKKLAMDVSYEGFAIYGRVLCLVVKRRDGQSQQARGEARGAKPGGQGQARMENWITSTQVPVGEDLP